MAGGIKMGIKDRRIIEDLAPVIHKIRNPYVPSFQMNKDDVMLFFSLDVVNSTIYKALNKKSWADAISEILRLSISIFVNSSSDDYRVWKSLGDEIVYTKQLDSLDAIPDSLDEIYRKLNLLNQTILSGSICDEESSKVLSVKATAWIATISTSCQDADNISIAYQVSDNRRYMDYLGPDIDIGFRVSDYSISNRLLISYDLAYLLLNSDFSNEIRQKVNFIAFTDLKGVWQQMLYPIFCYHGDHKTSFVDSISAEDIKESEIFKSYLNDVTAEKLHPTESYDSYEAMIVDKLCTKMRYKNKIDGLTSILNSKKKEIPRSVKPLYKVHYTIIGYSVENDDVSFMLLKNKSTHQWGFDEINAYYTPDFATMIQDYFKDQFRIEICLEFDKRYHSQTPLLISSYTYSDEDDKPIKGMVFLAEMKSRSYEIKTSQYTDVKFISEKEVEDLNQLPSFGSDYKDNCQNLLRLCQKELAYIRR